MARYRWVCAVMVLCAAGAVGGDPTPRPDDPPTPAGGPRPTDPLAEPVPEIVIPAADGLHPRRLPPPPPVCEPPGRLTPGIWPPSPTPGMPPAPGTPGTPETPPTPPTDPGPTARAPEAGTQPAGSINPNLFGDQLNGAGRGFLGQRVSFSLLDRNAADFARYQGNVNNSRFTPHQDFADQFPAVVIVNGRQLSVGRPAFAARQGIRSTPSQNFPAVTFLLENAQVTAILGAVSSAGGVRYVSGMAIERPDTDVLITPHEIQLTYDLNVGLALPLPVDRVGRIKLSDDNSPLPRDRFILNYDYFANPPLTGGLDIHRTVVGVETTFFDRQASFEVRLPFASTLDNLGTAGGVAARDLEIGDVYTAVKGLWYQSPELSASAGFSLGFPTASDTVLQNVDGSERVRIKNGSILAAPFVAVMYTPGERFFAQAWIQGSFDLTGNPVHTNFDGAGLRETGRSRDQSRLSSDLQVGYWVYRRSAGDGLRGLAPFFELHYNTTISDASRVQAAPTTVIGGTDNRFDEVNATVGMTALFGSNLMVMAGLVVPLRESLDRFFDYQFGVRASWFFGPTALAREQADAAGARPEALPFQTPGAIPPAGPRVMQAEATADAPLPLPATAVTAAPPAYGCGNTFTPGFFGDVVILSAFQGLTRLAASPAYHGTKPTDRDGPRLADRFYFGYDRADGVIAGGNRPGQPEQRVTRQIIGFETTFEDRVSVGLRLPFLQQDGAIDTAELREIGDLTAVFKYAIVNDPGNGNAFTIGLNLTVPTGGRGDTLAGGLPLPRAVFAQPWVGAVWNAGDLFLQGTSSLLLPTNPAYPVAMFNSVGGGYWVYRDDLDTVLRGIAPVVEFHASNPITNRGVEENLLLRTQVNMTTGLFLQFSRLSAGAAVSFPLTSPRPYDVGGLFTVSYQF